MFRLLYYKKQALKKQLIICLSKLIEHPRGANILILSDRGVDEYHVAMPSLLAVSGLQQHLVRTKKSTSVELFWRPENQEKYIILRHYFGYGACADQPVSCT